MLSNHELNLEKAAERFSIARPPRPSSFDGFTMQSLCEALRNEWKPGFRAALRAAILGRPITTRADARSVLALIEDSNDDAELSHDLLQCVRLYLDAA